MTNLNARTVVTSIEQFQFNALSERAKNNALDEMRSSGSIDLESHVDEIVETGKKFAEAFMCKLVDWSLDLSGSGYGDYLEAKENSSGYYGDDILTMTGVRLFKYIQNNRSHLLDGECPFTGVCYDENALSAIRDFMKKPVDGPTLLDLVHNGLDNLVKAFAADGQYLNSDECLQERAINDEIWFLEDGSLAA